MKNPTMSRLASILILISISLVSCRTDVAQTSVPYEPSPITEFTITSSPSAVPLLKPTEMVVPTATLTPPISFSLELRDSEIRRLMNDDSKCKFPCFLGIVPEQTTLGELKNILQMLGLSPAIYKDIVYNIYNYPDKDIPPHAQFFIYKEKVNSIKIDIEQKNEFEWSLYSPANVLKRLGAPSFVTFGLQVVHEPTPTPWKAWYIMTFYYDDLDFIIQYGTPEIRLDELIIVCPNKDNFEYTRIWLGKNPDHAPLQLWDGPLEQVTSFSLESFREYLLAGPGACFYLKRDAIPIY